MTSLQEAHAGLQRALDKAERDYPGWKEDAYNLFKVYIKTVGKGNTFMVEAFRDFAKDELPEPPNSRAYGVVAVRGKKDDLIEKVGLVNKNTKGSHGHAAVLWRVK